MGLPLMGNADIVSPRSPNATSGRFHESKPRLEMLQSPPRSIESESQSDRLKRRGSTSIGMSTLPGASRFKENSMKKAKVEARDVK